MYIAYFNKKKPRVPLIPWVSFDTARFTVRVRVTVCAGSRTEWENPTCGIPVLNTTQEEIPLNYDCNGIHQSKSCQDMSVHAQTSNHTPCYIWEFLIKVL